MELPFTHRPGRRERHLLRQHENPLFAWPPREVEPEALLAAQKADHEEMEGFLVAFRGLVQQAVDLPSDASSDAVLGLKEALESCYEQACGLPEDHERDKASIRRLIAVIMKTIWHHAGADPIAHQELSDEETARAIHFRLLEQPLVADLLHPQSPIMPAELIPSLLTATEAEAEAACEVFDGDQLAMLVPQAEALLHHLERVHVDVDQPRRRLALLRLRLEQYDTGEDED